MNRERIKGIVIGFIFCAVFSTGVMVAASTQTETREITYGIGVILNGQTVQFDYDSRPFVMDGRTFLPLRTLAELLDMPVDFDPTTNMAIVGQKTAEFIRPDNVTDFTPVALIDAPLASTSGYAWSFMESSIDNRGNTRQNCYEFTYGGEARTYSLNGIFTKIEGTIYRPYAARDNQILGSKIKIYGDDNLLYESHIFIGETAPAQFSIDISDIQTLRIETENNNTHGMLYNMIGISDVILYKN